MIGDLGRYKELSVGKYGYSGNSGTRISLYRGLLYQRSVPYILLLATLVRLKNVVRYTNDFVIKRFVKSGFHCSQLIGQSFSHDQSISHQEGTQLIDWSVMISQSVSLSVSHDQSISQQVKT